jgi:hypothetical protein
LRSEQQLQSYRKLHTDELAELWQTLNECKQTIASLSTPAGISKPVVATPIYAGYPVPGAYKEEKGGE